MKFSLSKLFSKSLSYLSIVVLAFALYLGFDVLLTQVKTDTSKEVVIASLGAIFLVLSTKFLMEKQSENKLGEERRKDLFKDNLNDYRMAADSIMRILRDDQLNPNELNSMREIYAKLILLGSRDTIEKSRTFITKCYEYLENDPSTNEILRLTPEQSQKLWDLALDFLASARTSLQIEDDSFDFKKESEAFSKLNKKQFDVKRKYARQELSGGVSEWVKHKKIPVEKTKQIESFISLVTDTNSSIQTKCTERQIAFFDLSNPWGPNKGRVMFLESYSKTRESLVLTLNGKKDEEFIKELGNDLSRLDGYMRNPKPGVYDIKFYVPLKDINTGDLSVLFSVIKRYISRFHVQSQSNIEL